MRALPPAVRSIAANLLRLAGPGDGAALLTGFGLLFTGYVLAFATTLDQPLLRSVNFAAINVLGAYAASLLLHPLIARLVDKRRSSWAVLAHPPLAMAFAIIWYFCTLAGFALTPDWLSEGLRVAPFGPVALSWQLFQGVTVYAALALFISWRHALRELERQRESLSTSRIEPTDRSAMIPRTNSLLIRCEKEVVPIAANDLVRIAGADGYSEVITRDRRILSTTSLARFEEILPGDQFVRAHRSHIVRLGAVKHAEPAGNARLLLHLEDGEKIMTSRAGARRLRELTV